MFNLRSSKPYRIVTWGSNSSPKLFSWLSYISAISICFNKSYQLSELKNKGAKTKNNKANKLKVIYKE